MTTATKAPTKQSVMDGLAERGQRWNKARADEDALAREYGAKIREAQALIDARRQAAHRSPELVNHKGEPTSKDNEVAAIDRELQKLGDLEDLWKQVEHARRLEQSAKQAWGDFVAAHFSELIEASREEAEAVAAEANAAAQALVGALNRYLEFHSQIAGYTHPVPNIDARIVPGLDAAANFLRVAETVDLKPPLPTMPEEVS
jgi:hypothetical protein